MFHVFLEDSKMCAWRLHRYKTWPNILNSKFDYIYILRVLNVWNEQGIYIVVYSIYIYIYIYIYVYIYIFIVNLVNFVKRFKASGFGNYEIHDAKNVSENRKMSKASHKKVDNIFIIIYHFLQLKLIWRLSLYSYMGKLDDIYDLRPCILKLHWNLLPLLPLF